MLHEAKNETGFVFRRFKSNRMMKCKCSILLFLEKKASEKKLNYYFLFNYFYD